MEREPALSPSLRRLLTALLALVPVLFFGALEGGLRLFGFGEDYPLFIPVPEYAGFQYQNPEVARRYFKAQKTVPTGLRDYFEVEKDSATFRIFVQGGSTAAGYPLYYGGSFSRMLEQRLLQTFPGRNVEVVNTAMAAVNSYTLRDLADEIVAQEPDLVLIYAGHNEYYGTLGVGSAESFGRSRWIVNLYLRLEHLRTVQLIQNALQGATKSVAGEEPDDFPGQTMMSRIVREQSIPLGSELYRRGLEQFRGNLRDLLGIYRDTGVQVLLATVASNERDQPPFTSGLSPATDPDAWQQAYASARRSLARGDTAQAVSRLAALVLQDTTSANAWFAYGQALAAAGHMDEAREAYIAAREHDQLRFRAPQAVNRIIREEAAAGGATVVEVEEALRRASPEGIIGKELMLEHLHPNVDGYFEIADAFYEALRARGDIGAWTRPVSRATARAEVLFTAVDSLTAVFRVRQLMNSWPFQPIGFQGPEILLQSEDPVERIAFDLYKRRTGWYAATDALRAIYETQGDYHAALKTSLALIQEYPFAVPPYLLAGNVLVKQKRYADAVNYFLAADERGPSAPAQRMIGSIYLQQNRRAEAIDWLERSLKLEPDDPKALYNLAGAYALESRFGEAHALLDRLLAQHPDHQDALRLKISLGGGMKGEALKDSK